MENACALILRGFSHCDGIKDTRGNILSYTLDDYKDNITRCLLEPLKRKYSVIDIYIFANNVLREEAFFKPVHVHVYNGLESTQLHKLCDMCEFIPKVYSRYVIHRFDVLYKCPLDFSHTKNAIVCPYRQNKIPENVQWGLDHPLWNDVYFDIPSQHMNTFIDLLREQIRRKPMYHLMLHGVYKICLERNVPVHFLHQGMFNIERNPFFSFLRSNKKMTICIAYKGLSYLESFRNHHGVCTFSMLDVLDNHFKMLVEPLRARGHRVVFAISTNASPIVNTIVQMLGDCVYVSTDGTNQMDRAHHILECIPQDVTHVVMTRCDVRFKSKITEIPIQWDKMNFPWINFDRSYPRNGDVVYIFPKRLFSHVSNAYKHLHEYFTSRKETPHGHGFYKRFFKHLDVACMLSDFYNSNTDVTQNPLFELARSFNKKVPLHPKVQLVITHVRRN